MSQTEDEVHVFATLVAKPGKEDELRSVLMELVTCTKSEPGNLYYLLHEDPKAPGSFYFFESYDDQAALDTHMNSPHLAKAFEKAGEMLREAPNITATKLVAGS